MVDIDFAAEILKVEAAHARAQERHQKELQQATERGMAAALKLVAPPFDDLLLSLRVPQDCKSLQEGLRLVVKKAAQIRKEIDI